MTLYVNAATGEFGQDLQTLSRRLAQAVSDLAARPALLAGWTPYATTTPPTPGFGQVAIETPPLGGVQTWVLQYAATPLSTLIGELAAAIDAERVRRAALPLTYDFGTTFAISDAGASAVAGPHPLQATPADLANLQVAFASALALVVAGTPTAAYPLRTADNLNVQTTARQALAAIGALFARQTALIFHAAAAKAAAGRLTTVAAIAAVDPAAGWPS